MSGSAGAAWRSGSGAATVPGVNNTGGTGELQQSAQAWAWAVTGWPSASTHCVPALVHTSVPVARWRYDVEPVGSGCRLTESWTDRRGALMTRLGALVTGVRDRRAYAATSMEVTLRRVKATAEGKVGDAA